MLWLNELSGYNQFAHLDTEAVVLLVAAGLHKHNKCKQSQTVVFNAFDICPNLHFNILLFILCVCVCV